MMEGMQNNQTGQQPGAAMGQPVTATGDQPITIEPPVEETTAPVVSMVVTMEAKKEEAIRMALEMARQVPDWEPFFRGMMGNGGVIEQLFPHRDARLEFKQMPEYLEIQRMMARLREQLNKRSKPDREVTRVITVRLPQSLHSALMSEASDLNTSMNKLCISKLLQVIDDDLVC